MNLFIRFIVLIIKRCISSKPVDPLGMCITPFRVNPLDLDVNLHMNNGRYLSIMDLGRIDLMIRAGMFWKIIKQGYFPVVASQSIRFKRSLMPFQKFHLITQIQAWDEKDFYISQKFVCNKQVYAEGFIKGRFLKRGQKGSVPTRDIFKHFNMNYADGKITDLSGLQKNIEKLLVKDTHFED